MQRFRGGAPLSHLPVSGALTMIGSPARKTYPGHAREHPSPARPRSGPCHPRDPRFHLPRLRQEPGALRPLQRPGVYQNSVPGLYAGHDSESFTAGALSYTFTQRLLTVAGTGTYYIRWTRPNGYQILPPYGDLPDDPWFPRVGFNINPWAPEWARQLFNPSRHIS